MDGVKTNQKFVDVRDIRAGLRYLGRRDEHLSGTIDDRPGRTAEIYLRGPQIANC